MRIDIPQLAYSVINTVYPPDNHIEFERFLYKNYIECNTDRVFLPITWTACYVNNNYGNDKEYLSLLQKYIDSLDTSVKYWTCVQYDDGILNDVSKLDLLQFNMSKKIGVEIPLLCQPHPYKFDSEKKYLVSFVGSRTHPIRNKLEKLKDKEDYYISFDPHSIEEYCRILHESIFALCPRGYGLNSFRISESLQYGAIPIYFSDEFILPFSYYGNIPGWMLLMNSNYVDDISREVSFFSNSNIISLQDAGKTAYNKYYTYNGCFEKIIESLENEYHSRTNPGKAQSFIAGIIEAGD